MYILPYSFTDPKNGEFNSMQCEIIMIYFLWLIVIKKKISSNTNVFLPPFFLKKINGIEPLQVH